MAAVGVAVNQRAYAPAVSYAPSIDPYAFLVDQLIDGHTLAWATEQSRRTGELPHKVLISNGHLTEADYIAALCANLAVRFDRVQRPAARETEVIDGLGGDPDVVFETGRRLLAVGIAPLPVSSPSREIRSLEHARWERVRAAARGFHKQNPDLSAAAKFPAWQLVALTVVIGLGLGAFAGAPQVGEKFVVIGLSMAFVVVVALRAVALVMTLFVAPRSARPSRRPAATLPIYSIIVPLFREESALADVVAALERLEYPVGRLDVMLVLESTDQATQAAAQLLRLPPHMRIVIIPDLLPRTKPKALNYALQMARGEYVVVFDAEDEPEPDQLLRALAMFEADPRLCCVQARLDIYNWRENWLTRQFALEYGALFSGLLPCFERLGLAMPLGGTSNHFRRRDLQRFGAWDAYNVTEDADLGVRIARRGGRIAVLDAVTHEQAPPELRVWIRQRTRWLKGYIQTWSVHMRDPAKLMAELGVWSFIGFQGYVGGLLIAALVYPVFLIVLLAQLGQGHWLIGAGGDLGAWVAVLCAANLVLGNLSALALAGHIALRRGRWTLLPDLILTPWYWLLISVAAYRALFQLWQAPYAWEKTPHEMTDRQRQMRRSALAARSSRHQH